MIIKGIFWGTVLMTLIVLVLVGFVGMALTFEPRFGVAFFGGVMGLGGFAVDWKDQQHYKRLWKEIER